MLWDLTAPGGFAGRIICKVDGGIDKILRDGPLRTPGGGFSRGKWLPALNVRHPLGVWKTFSGSVGKGNGSQSTLSFVVVFLG